MGRPRKHPAARSREGGTAGAGTVSHRPQPATAELVVVAGRNVPIDPPDDLPPDAVDLWVALVRELADAGIIDRIDLPMLRLFCLQHARAWSAHRAIDEPVDDRELEDLDDRIQQMETITNALKTRIAGILRIGQAPDTKDVNAAANYERELTNLRAYSHARRSYGNLVALGSTGQLVEHPLVATERHAAGLALRFAAQFGVTPQGRAQLGLLIVDAQRGARDLDSVIGARPPTEAPTKPRRKARGK